MGERYVRPPLVAREARSHAWTVWPFRGLLLLLAVLCVVLLAVAYSRLNDAAGQAPGVEARGALTPAGELVTELTAAAPAR